MKKISGTYDVKASGWMSFLYAEKERKENKMLLSKGYVPCNRQIHIKLSEEDLKMIHKRMEQIGVKNMSAYIRKMAIDGYYIRIDFSELLELIKLMRIDSNNINQIAKVANSCGTVDSKTISDMKEDHERVLKKVEKTFNKYVDIY